MAQQHEYHTLLSPVTTHQTEDGICQKQCLQLYHCCYCWAQW